MSKFFLTISFILLMIGAAGITNEAGNIQPVCVVMCVVGALGMFSVGRAYYFGS